MRPNSYTPASDVQQMREFYLERVSEIIKDEVIIEKDLYIESLQNQMITMQQQLPSQYIKEKGVLKAENE